MRYEDREIARKVIGRNIRHLASDRGLKPADLSYAIKTHPNSIYALMNGKRMPSALTAKRLADALECSVDELLEGVE